MRVWIVFYDFDYDGGLRVDKVFSRAELAEARVASSEGGEVIEEYDVDSPWSCPDCVVRPTADAPHGRIVAACNGCIPMIHRTPQTHPNPLERLPEGWDRDGNGKGEQPGE